MPHSVASIADTLFSTRWTSQNQPSFPSSQSTTLSPGHRQQPCSSTSPQFPSACQARCEPLMLLPSRHRFEPISRTSNSTTGRTPNIACFNRMSPRSLSVCLSPLLKVLVPVEKSNAPFAPAVMAAARSGFVVVVTARHKSHRWHDHGCLSPFCDERQQQCRWWCLVQGARKCAREPKS